MIHHPGIYIAPSKIHNRGIFTSKAIQKKDIIEVCPVISIPSKQLKHIDKTILFDYYFNWPDPKHPACILMGYGGIYNHSFKPNAEMIADVVSQTMSVKCIRSIPEGKEILIDYCDGKKNRKNLWFKPK